MKWLYERENHVIKKGWPRVSAWTGMLKNPTKMSMALGARL